MTRVDADSHGGTAVRAASWSLRVRLVTTMTALLALICLVMGITTQLALHLALYTQLDKQLREAAAISHTFVDDVNGPVRTPGVPGAVVPSRTLALVARLGDGRVDRFVVLNGGEVRPSPSQTAALLAVAPDGRPHTARIDGLGDYRLVARFAPQVQRVVVTGLPLHDTRLVINWVAGTEIAVAVAALLAAGCAGAVIVRRSLRPLRRMAATAGRVAELRLDHGEVALAERVPRTDTDPRTEVGQVGAALNRMLGQVSGALEARHASDIRIRQFVADASHELRTPLAAIQGYAELTRRGRAGLPPDQAHLLSRVESEAHRMTALVEDLLLLARLDAGRPLARQPVDLAVLVVDAVSDAHTAGPEQDWRLDLPGGPVTVLGDHARLYQVLGNLLSNARTHTPPGTRVTVGVSTDGDEAVLRVVDRGPGIPAGLLPRIFERFARGDTSRSRAAGSTGLGLAVVHAVTTAHAGTVRVHSAPGRTAFTVRLPLVGTEAAGPDHATSPGLPDAMVFRIDAAVRATGGPALKR